MRASGHHVDEFARADGDHTAHQHRNDPDGNGAKAHCRLARGIKEIERRQRKGTDGIADGHALRFPR